MSVRNADDWSHLLDVLTYEPDTGIFRWKVDVRGTVAPAGAVAGGLNDQGYWRIKYRRKFYRANRLAYFFMTGEIPEHEVDHINGQRDDNRWCNLRHVTRHQNEANKPSKGVRQKGSTFEARICVRGRRVELGRYRSEAEALAAYRGAARVAFGEFASRKA